jgi:hypothetical protein
VVPFSTTVLAAIERAYDEKPTQDGPQRYRFTGRFADHTPKDIGGSGSYIVIESPLGDICAYVERFRGNDDLVGQLATVARAANRLTDLLLGWFESQMHDDTSWPKLRAFLDVEFRRDLHNLALYVWLGQTNASNGERYEETPAGDGGWPEEVRPTLARLAQYLIEHGYLDPHEAMDFARQLAAATEGIDTVQAINAVEGPLVASYVQKVLARKCELEPAQGATSLAFLLDVAKVAESFSSFVKQTPEFEELRRTRIAKQQTPPDADEVMANIIIEDVLHFHLFEHADELDLSLAISEKPLATNGEWDEAAERVMWRRSINADGGLPTLCFAAWCEPRIASQEKHFGRVILHGNALAEYVALYSMLDAEARTELALFIEALDHADDKSRIHAYAYKLRKGNPLLRKIGTVLAGAIEQE